MNFKCFLRARNEKTVFSLRFYRVTARMMNLLLLFLYMFMFLCNFPLLCYYKHLGFFRVIYLLWKHWWYLSRRLQMFCYFFYSISSNLSIGWGAQDYVAVGLTLVSNFFVQKSVCVTLALCQVKHPPSSLLSNKKECDNFETGRYF